MTQALDDLAAVMFRTFSRFEYALKAAGFHEGNGPAKPDWERFARSIPDLFDDPSDRDLSQAVHYMLSCPPKR